MTTAFDLAALWQERDRRYAARRIMGIKTPLTLDEEDSVRAWRRSEIDTLPADERSAAWGALGRWTPPAVKRR